MTGAASGTRARTLPAGPITGPTAGPTGGPTGGPTILTAIVTGDVRIFASGEQPTAIGMEVDAYGRLGVAGGQSGSVFVYDSTNGNGTSPDQRSVLIVQSNTGLLFRVELATGEVSQVRAPDLSTGDGMFRDGDVLYVVRNQIGQVELLRPSPTGDTALTDPDGSITSPAFGFTTTTIVREGSLYAVNSKFDRQGGQPDLPFEVVRVPLP